MRESDKNEIDHDLKDIFISNTKDSAMENSITSRVNGHQSIQGVYTIWRGSLDIYSLTFRILKV